MEFKRWQIQQGYFHLFLLPMRFYGIKDFYENKELHQIKYMMMDEKQKRAYKRFVYSICFLKEDVKDIIWEYLNNDDDSNEKITTLYNKRYGKRL